MTVMTPGAVDPQVKHETARRRTFAIISHPDAGKTTLTEKLLLYGGCVDVAGAVRGRKTQRAATSDWMELERRRGISVSSTVLTFEFENFYVNLLDTPGHHDFSEDTYRTLMAADCAVMVLDQAKGVEPQTEKLFRVCALRGLPVITFINKVDRPGLEPLAVLGEIEQKLGIEPVPHNWPIGSGQDFCGIAEIGSGLSHVFVKGSQSLRTAYESLPLAALPEETVSPAVRAKALEELELLEMAGPDLDPQRFLEGKVTPVFFGSALNNYGVEHFLRGFLGLCPAPTARQSDQGPVQVDRPDFGGFIFKIQANLDPKHRDRVAFLRVCAGKFLREMEVFHPRSGKKIRLKRSHRLFAQERETMDEAFPGDIIGLVNPGEFQLGDTICVGSPINFEPLPLFSPEHFAILRCTDTARRKQFGRGLEQLTEEGAIQVFQSPDAMQRDPILAAVGELQFDVVRFRLETEYNTQTSIDWLPFKVARWVAADDDVEGVRLPYGTRRVVDRNGRTAFLFQSKWDAEYCTRENPKIHFSEIGTL
jgi:peptide chain release factor 3